LLAYISGKLTYKSTKSVIIDVNGIGFHVFIPLSTYYRLPENNERINLFTYFYVREDMISIYGFKTGEEKEAFGMLISVTGVGPKLAIKVLSELSIEEFKSAVVRNDPGLLTSIPGVGKKIGQRLLLELKEKVASLPGKEAEWDGRRDLADDAISALVSLGYTQSASCNAVKKVLESTKEDSHRMDEVLPKAEISLETIIKRTLKELR